MARYETIQTDFSGGLMSPHLRGRIDLDKYPKSCQELNNFIPSLQGPISYRPGTQRFAELSGSKVRSIPFVSGFNNQFLIILTPQLLEIYNRQGELEGSVAVSYLEEELDDLSYHQEVNELHFSHVNHKPAKLVINELEPVLLSDSLGSPLEDSNESQLYALNAGNLSDDDWSFGEVDFLSHPFLPADESGANLRMDPAEEVLRVTSTNPSEFDGIQLYDSGTPRDIYVEYRVGDVWGLGRLLGEATSPSVPFDPQGNTAYIEPVSRVVDIQDQSATFYPIINDGSQSAMDDIFKAFGVKEGEGKVICDTAVFEAKHRFAWLRIPADRLFERRVPTIPSFFTGGEEDSLPMWVRIDKHIGLEDQPVDFLNEDNGVGLQSNYESGSVYEVLNWGSQQGPLEVRDAAASPNVTARVTKGASSPRFTMNTTLTFGQGGASDFLVANLNTQKQVDAVTFKTEDGWLYRQPKTTGGSGSFVIKPTGTLTVLDNRSDNLQGTAVRHRTTVRSSRPLFDLNRDPGRYIHAQLGTDWVLLQVRSIGTVTEAQCEIYSPVPISQRTGDLANAGVFSRFRLGAWYQGNWPRVVSFYERRRVYAGTLSHPNLVWLSKMNNQYDFRTVEDDGEVIDTSGITYPLGTASMRIRWLSPGQTLVVGTNAGEWQLRPNEFAGAVTPENIRISEETQIGSLTSHVRVGGSVFFVDRSARAVYEFYFDPQAQGFFVRTVTKLVDTIFDEDPIVRMHYQQYPYSMFWFITESGRIFGLTYRREDDFYAWSEINFAGKVKDLAVLPRDRDEEDRVWLVVAYDGTQFLEQLETIANAVRLDSWRQYGQGDLDQPDAMVVEGTGDPYIDGLYPRDGDESGFPKYVVAGTVKEIYMGGTWLLIWSTGSEDEVTSTDSTSPTPDLVDSWSDPNMTVRRATWADIVDPPDPSVYVGDDFDPDETVAVVVNGEYLGQYVVGAEGWIELAGVDRESIETIHVGYPYQASAKLMPINFEMQGKMAYGQPKRLVTIRPYLYRTACYFAGMDENMEQFDVQNGGLFTGFGEEVPIPDAQFDNETAPTIKQLLPKPLTVVSLTLRFDAS